MEREFKLASIKLALEKRCQNYKDNQSIMIDSIINRQRHTIYLDCCIDGSNSKRGLLTDPEDVLNETNRHFQRVTGTIHHS